jgi:putative transposase
VSYRVWRTARATVHRRRAPPRQVAPRRPGPVGAMPDAALAEAIRAVLAAGPFRGEGHRKVRARLRHTGVRSSGLPGRMSQWLSEGTERRNSRLPAA